MLAVSPFLHEIADRSCGLLLPSFCRFVAQHAFYEQKWPCVASYFIALLILATSGMMPLIFCGEQPLFGACCEPFSTRDC